MFLPIFSLLSNMRPAIYAISDLSFLSFSPVVFRSLAADTLRFFAVGDSCQNVIEPSKHNGGVDNARAGRNENRNSQERVRICFTFYRPPETGCPSCTKRINAPGKYTRAIAPKLLISP